MMDELAYRRYCDRRKAADDIFRAVKGMYPSLTWQDAYLRAVKARLLTKDDRELVREFHCVSSENDFKVGFNGGDKESNNAW